MGVKPAQRNIVQKRWAGVAGADRSKNAGTALDNVEPMDAGGVKCVSYSI